MGAWIAVFLREAKVNDVHLVSSLGKAHHEVVWLDVTVQEAL